jgi:RNA polymerase sigma-70 factor (ECF subfamily)
MAPVTPARTARDLEAAVQAVRRGLLAHRPTLLAHARRLTGHRSEAEDVLQDTFCRALEFAHGFAAGTNVKAWLHQVLQSVFLTRCRRRTRERRTLDAAFHDPCCWMRAEHAPSMLELSPPVQSALEGLPSGFRDVVRLVDVEDRSYRDAASALAVPLGTVMSRLHRGRRLLASALIDADAGSPWAA